MRGSPNPDAALVMNAVTIARIEAISFGSRGECDFFARWICVWMMFAGGAIAQRVEPVDTAWFPADLWLIRYDKCDLALRPTHPGRLKRALARPRRAS